jgi:hypothetical protein
MLFGCEERSDEQPKISKKIGERSSLISKKIAQDWVGCVATYTIRASIKN